MVRSRVVFCEVVGFVQFAWSPIDMKLSLSGAIAYPIKSHIDGLGAFLFDSVVCNSDCSTVVGLDGRWWLGMAEFFEASA